MESSIGTPTPALPHEGGGGACDGAIRFLLNGAAVEIVDRLPTTTLLNWLRYERRLTGTKEGCAEGDCGACTVALRALEPDGVTTRPVCACIMTLGQLHGREIVTVEGVAAPDGRLHPVQAALAEGHGSQCGFCTPGFVMSLWCLYRVGEPPDPVRVNDRLAGNLCRCTGYGPIVAAARAALERPAPDWEATDADAASRLRALGADGPLAHAADGRRFWSPVTLDGLAGLVAAHPEATVLSGATDVGLWITKRAFDPREVIWTGRVAELHEVREEGGALWIGAAATYAEAEARIGALWPGIGRMLRRLGGAQVRAAGTVGGNIANGSPVGDMPPALIAARAVLVLRRGADRRELPLEAFFLDYGRQDRRPGEFVEGVSVPLPSPEGEGRRSDGGRLRCYKVSKRFDQDISAVLGCFDVGVEGGRVTAARLAYGGMAGVPKRATAAEAALVGQPWTRVTVEAAMAAMERDFAPLSDWRASAGYRIRVAQNLLMRYFVESTEPSTATDVLELA
jgi:xanthine dehydrogenase small subunit